MIKNYNRGFRQQKTAAFCKTAVDVSYDFAVITAVYVLLINSVFYSNLKC